jgi:hypothetical protein
MVAFEVFGDSNIAKSWKAVASDLDQLKGSVLRQTTTQISLRDHLKTVAQSTRYAIVSAISNPISRLKFEGPALLEQAVTDRCNEILDYLVQTLNTNPELKVYSSQFNFLPYCMVSGLLRPLSLPELHRIYCFQIFVSPPLHRCQPYWYSTNFTLIASGFSTSFSHCPERLYLLPQYDCSPASFNVDGVHFTPGEGER